MNLLLLAITILCPIHRAVAMSGPRQQSQASAQTTAPQSPFAGLIAEYLRRDANGHSPTAEEISAMDSLQPPPDAASISEAMPYLLKALANPDVPMRTFALTALSGMQSPVAESATGDGNLKPNMPAHFKADTSKVLTPFIPQIAAHLTSEEGKENRLLVAAILGGFTPNPPAAVYSPLLAYLKRDDAISPVGLAVVSDLIQLGPVNEEAAAAITRYIRRSDHTADSRSNLADTIASASSQSQAVDRALLFYLDSDDSSLRARVILSLPQLDMSPDVFADTKARIERIAIDPSENLQVVTAAKSISACWTAPKMTSVCPVY